MNHLKRLVYKTRTVRRFKNRHHVDMDTLTDLVDLARMGASAANLQPLRYLLISDPHEADKIFPCLRWAAYLEDWAGPSSEERPAAYIVVVCKADVVATSLIDCGIAVQNILLGATERQLGGCVITALEKQRLRDNLLIMEGFDIVCVVALGVPKEKIIVDDLEPGADIRYWRDKEGCHHVPKRRLKDVILSSIA